jgi:D-alanyl-D-alanine carboxypeptidase
VSSDRGNRSWAIWAALVFVAGAVVLTPVASSAQEGDATERREDVRDRRAQIDLEVDALQADVAEVNQALARLQRNVATQRAELAEAERSFRAAQADVAEAEQAVADAERRIADLERDTDELVVESFVNPPSSHALDAFSADNVSDAAVTQALLNLQAEADADMLDQLGAAREDLQIEQRNKREAAADAEDKRDVSRSELADLEDAMSQQQAFADEVERRLDRQLAEAEALRAVDAELSRQIEAEQAEAARRLRELQEAQAAIQASTGANPPPPEPTDGGGIQEVPGGLATVSCPTGGSITVAASIASNVQGLLDLAGQQGVPLCGGGYRDPEQQIQLRREHCGTSYYAIYEMPSSQCNPPTARPGSSMHEQGLAIDFTCAGGSVEVGGVCWNFLDAHANDYGLYNYPAEPWHWSTDGT